MPDFETKDSGQHEEYASGMRRDSQAGKPRFDLIRTKAQPYRDQMIYRYAMLLARGAEKYEDRNWESGDSEVELERAKASLLRHVEQLVGGERDEDHAAAVWFNTQQIEYLTWRMEQKALAVTAFDEGGIAIDQPSPTHDFKGIQDAINDWHNRVRSGDFFRLTPGPPATPEDRIRARVNLIAARQRLSPSSTGTAIRRPGDWLDFFGIEILEGDLGDTYKEIDIVEFDRRLKTDGVVIQKLPVDDDSDFD